MILHDGGGGEKRRILGISYACLKFHPGDIFNYSFVPGEFQGILYIVIPAVLIMSPPRGGIYNSFVILERCSGNPMSECNHVVGHGCALVESKPFERRVLGLIPALPAT